MRLTPLTLLLIAIGSHALAAPPAGTTAKLAILETTDLHANVLGYDYFKLAPDPSIGLERTATLIAEARREFPNTLLLDNGDTIQGNALSDFQAIEQPVGCGQPLAIHKAMRALAYDGGTIGNHEFNYGLPYLQQVSGTSAARCAGPGYPLVLANVVDAKTGLPVFAPYHLIDKRVRAVGPDGQPRETTLRIGIIGFTPPAVLTWDRRWLEGRVRTLGIKEAAERYVPEMRAKGADLVVVLSHAGLETGPYSPSQENPNLSLAQVPGIDALLMGHLHLSFPDAGSQYAAFNQPGVDKVAGRVRGVPAVMASMWGKALGVIGLQLRSDGKRWLVQSEQTRVEVRSTQRPDKSYVAADPRFADLIAAEHAATIGFVKTPIGSTDFRMASTLADVGDVSAIEIVNLAQTEYVRDYVRANLPQYAALPVLSMSAPFKSGNAGPRDYTDVKPGPLAINHAADLYLYPNLLYAVKVNGDGLKAWLEKSAERFNRIDPSQRAPQELVNANTPGFNFDMPTTPALQYEIDLTQPAGQRVRALQYQGKDVTAAMEFIVATNSYRASGGGNFPGLDGSKTIFASPDASRDVLIAYIKRVKQLHHAEHGAQRSWRFSRVQTAGPVLFRAAPDAQTLATAAGIGNVRLIEASDAQGYAVFALDLGQ
ncbi:bifunctional 2',3'-cyclic-nucleotide 2'-phosphodiesterase/3'-nucleotidase [Massilia sp. TS11]|uniref:bifunctional 2',3'-cyclic-nucleotide 2'-phosphodiesterase/3'-nucleotidase n=1 Tax=Massilia sp. TS11 TaxID=2908003 RepID=UPI001EDC1563|nr:bifunctional 2',3'-cyclic-nucleotide 2'-phosphodiesterase/3'-nucleotidase [Massilia sp. TS11]MCG2584591.1 bifunctional 2',3'-cyclic-nucleotide 2'-phosphodiesterase/3'-nucleotidase [Massilia sp. TS11]